MPRILIVEDDLNTRNGLGEILMDAGYDVILAEDSMQALAEISSGIDLVLLDLELPGMKGLDFLMIIKKQYPDLNSIIMTAFGSPEHRSRAEDLGVLSFLDKPLNIEQLLSVLKAALLHDECNGALVNN